jgi:hypothetical protein
MEKRKRVYTKPTILKVQLTHEQAVLSACSVVSISLAQSNKAWCKSTCRQHSNRTGSDSAWSS